MKRSSLRRVRGQIHVWPSTNNWAKEYAPCLVRATVLTRTAESYFFRNAGWRRWGGVFSHSHAHWTHQGWTVGVWFVGRRRRRRRRLNRLRRLWRRVVRAQLGWRIRYRLVPTIKWWARLAQHSSFWWQTATLWSSRRAETTFYWCKLGGRTRQGITAVMANLKTHLRGRIEIKPRRIAWPLMRKILKMRGVRGVSVRCHGRFTRRQRASHEVFKTGYLAPSARAIPVEEAFTTRRLRFGAVGVTVLVSYV